MPPMFDARVSRLEAAASLGPIDREPETIIDQAGTVAEILTIAIPAAKQKSI